MSKLITTRRYTVATSSWLAIIAATAATAVGGVAAAQTPPPASNTDNVVDELVVVGARASQQSAIDRKKRASTPTDSIVAEDVGSFPDRNLNEAISRIAGVALGRNDYGEGESISIRGNGPDFTRVELDGIGVQSAGGSLAISGAGEGGRGADMRELPSDLIKSVDVIKGTTADMTEGSLGGSVKITTRSGLDFKKPYVSLRLGGAQNDLGKDTTYDVNLVATRKFFDDRLGVIFSTTASNPQYNSHKMETVTSGRAGYARSVDWDESDEKTFVYNPDLFNGDTADTVLANSEFTPRQIAAKSAAAANKDACLTAFPNIIDPAATQNNALRDRKTQRANEQISCLNQWNDYHPSNIRSFLNSQEEQRLAADIRFDYQVTDNLKVYAKYAIANRKVDDQFRNRNLGGVVINPSSIPPAFIDSLADQTVYPTNGTINYRTGVPAQGTWTYNDNYTTGTIVRDINPNPGGGSANVTNFNFPIYGQAVNVDPASVVVDANHHLTEFTAYGLSTNIDQIDNEIITESSYAQIGGEYWEGPLRMEFVANRSESTYTREDKRSSRAYPYGALNGATILSVQSSGLWDYALPDGYDETNPDNFVLLTTRNGAQGAIDPSFVNPDGKQAYTQAQRALTSQLYSVSYSPRAEEGEETALKFDLTYDLAEKSALFTQFKTGISYRDVGKRWWGGGGYEVSSARGAYDENLTPAQNVAAGYVPAVTVPTVNLRGNFRACSERGSPAAGFEPCNYGFQAGSFNREVFNPNRFELGGLHTFTEAQLRTLIADTVQPPESVFFDGYPGAGGSSWNGIDIDTLFAATGMSDVLNFNCLYTCTGSDGMMYEQPVNETQEKIVATYARLDFEHDLPFGMSFDGNVGIRRVQTDVNGSALLTFRSIRLNDPSIPTGATTTYDLRRPYTFNKSSVDILPSYNLGLWLIQDKLALRAYTAKTITRPPVSRLIPNGQCTIDERRIGATDDVGDDTDQDCSRIGNPELKPYTADDANLSVEWYPNRDTMFSLAYHELDVTTGGPINVTRTDFKIFAGTDAIDPETGMPLANVDFLVPTYENGPGFKRNGLEFSTKTAFTFLPWLFRYTGADFNYSKLRSDGNVRNIDPITGEGQAQPNESEYFANLSVWYDDGRVNARVSYQGRGEEFICISACGSNTVNNPPIGNPGELVRIPYNPGEPYYRSETKYIDAKVTYKIRPNLEVYLEGRNLRREAAIVVGSDRTGFADGQQNLWNIGYGGRRFMFGLVYRYGA